MRVTTTSTPEDLRQQIHRTFDDVPIPSSIDDMILTAFKGNDDPYEMAAEFVGKPWQEIPLQRLFFHRESLAFLSAAGYRAYLPAYLVGCLESTDYRDKYGADIQGYTLSTLKEWSHHNAAYRATVAERLSGLDPAQRAAVAAVLRYLVEFWESKEAAEVLRDW